MARSSIALLFLLLASLAMPAHAYYSPSLGRFINRDPGVEPILGGSSPAFQMVGRLAPRPYAGRGYHDGMNTYQAYFVPSYLDPSGLISEQDLAALKSIICDQLPGKDTKKNEWAIRIFRDNGGEGGLVGGNPDQGDSGVTTEGDYANSNPPAHAQNPVLVGEIHTHPNPVGPSKGDFGRWQATGLKYDLVVYDEAKCCKDGEGTGYMVYVFEWASKIDLFKKNKTIHKIPNSLNGLTNDEYNAIIDQVGKELEANKQLESYNKIEVCCPKK